jgi:MATE family multidrug resistance protein
MSTLLNRELRAILHLALPLVAAQLAYVIMLFTDTVMMGMLGPDALAAGSLGSSSYHFVSIVCVGVIAAVGSLVAIRHGAGDIEGVTRLTQAGLWLGWGLAALCAVLLWNLEPLLKASGQQEQNISGATQFLSALIFALPGYMTFMTLRGFTSAIGHPGPVMAISVGGAIANFVLNYALIKGWLGLPHLGLAGIGLVTAIVMTGMALLLGWYVMRHPAYREYQLSRGLFSPKVSDIRELLRLGLPIGGTYAVEAGLFTFAALCMGALGSHELAAHQIAIMSVYVAFMVPVGISYAATFRIGQHYGAGRLAEARLAGRLSISLGAICMLTVACLFWFAPQWVIGLFLDKSDSNYSEVVALAIAMLAVAAWFELFDGIQSIAMGAIRGLKDAKTTFIVGFFCYWGVGAPLAWVLTFPLGWGAEGVWWGLAGGLACAAIGLTLGFEWKTARLMRSPADSGAYFAFLKR